MAENNGAVPPGCKLPAGGFFGRLHVLVVDDDAAYLEELKLMLLLAGYAVTGKTTAEEALKEVDQNPEDYFHIIMTDVHMSGMDGFDLLHRINGRVPVIMFSEGEDVVMVMRTVMNGACDYMVKPMTSEAIKFIWKHVLRWRLSALPANASSSLQPSDHLAAALAAVAPPPPPAVQLPAAPAQAGNRDGEAHEEAELSTQPPALVPSGVQEAAAAVWSSRGDGQEAPPAAVAAAAKAPSKKRGASEVSDRGSNNLEATTGRKKVRTRFTWTTVSHTSFVRAYEQLKDQEGPKKIKQLMELDGIFVTKTQVSSHLQKYRSWLENERKKEEATSSSPCNPLSYTNCLDRGYSTWKQSSVITEGQQSSSFSGRPIHSMATSNGCLTTTNTQAGNYVGVGAKEIENFIFSHQRSLGTAIGQESTIEQASLHSEITSVSRDAHENGNSQARGSAMSNGTSGTRGVLVTNENLLHVVSASLPSNMGQPTQPSQSFCTNELAANYSIISDQNPGTSHPTSSSAINNQNSKTQEMSVSQTVELGCGNDVMLDWPELVGLEDQLDNDVLMNSFFDGDLLQQGVVTAIDGTQEMLAFDSTGDLGSVPPRGLNNEIASHENTNGKNGASSGP
ncbi:two-component response regulator ORR27 [Oryza glaberrima]|uniref:Response regulatory domain-containing protein n=2 Tax=Oryza TaxID=4527 RepID=A0A0D3G7B5_9ORYZ|nr:two-component response regulator ORR27 [Oryza glaberrima]